jgi:AraC family transcriptional regulator
MNEGHAHRFGTGPTRLFNVQVDRQWLSTVPDLADPRRDPVVLRGTRANALATRVYTEFKMRDGSSFSIEACMLALLAEIYRTRQPETPVTGRVWLSQAREILHHRFRERIDLVDLAATVGVHPVHFSRAFHQKVGCTLTEYVQRLRIDYARAKLATTEEPLSFIAIDAGFADQGHFTRRFRQATGTTPARFRASRTRAAS